MMRSALLVALAPLLFSACSGGPDSPASNVASAPAPAGLCEHEVPAAICTQCNPEMAPVFKAKGDWCDEHGVPESHCFRCNPALTFSEAPKDWCKEHGLPESKCTKCNPSLVAGYIEAGDYCREHGYPESACPICKGTSIFPPDGMRVRLASADTAGEVGIETVVAARRAFGRSLEVVGSLEFDPNRSADLAALDTSVVRSVHADVGDRVEANAPLVTLASAGVGARRAELRAAEVAASTAESRLARERRLFENGLAARAEVEVAEREAAAARANLRTARAGLDAAGASAGSSGGTYVLRAPFAGTLIERNATVGRSAEAGEVLVRLADPKAIRARLDLPEAHAASVRVGQPVTLELPGGATRSAQIDAVGAAVDPRTRTVPARVHLDAAGGALKGGTFLRARIAVGEAAPTVVIPQRAVQQVEGKAIVFVAEGQEGSYRPVAVELGAALGDEVAVRAGLQGGERVVTTGAFLLSTETRKDAIGAGCCEVE